MNSYMFFCLLLSIFIFYNHHPILFSFMLVLMAFFLSILLGKMLNSWFFYLLILIFLGGVMVIMLFMVSICANEKIFFKKLDFLWIFLFFFSNFFISKTLFCSYKIISLLYLNETSISFLFFCLILLLCLISVVSLTKLEHGPFVKRL